MALVLSAGPTCLCFEASEVEFERGLIVLIEVRPRRTIRALPRSQLSRRVECGGALVCCEWDQDLIAALRNCLALDSIDAQELLPAGSVSCVRIPHAAVCSVARDVGVEAVLGSVIVSGWFYSGDS